MENIIVERYPNIGIVKTRVFYKSIPHGVPACSRGKRGEAKDPEKSIAESLRRTKKKIFELILANKWEYWATQTFSNDKVDRYDIDNIIKKYLKRLEKIKERKYNFKYLLIPELHKDGAVHLHGFFSGIPDDKIVYSGYDYFNRNKLFKRPIYNWLDTLDFGFNDFIKLDVDDVVGYLKMAKYCTKYITKDLINGRFNRKKYWASRGLETSIKYKTSVDINSKEFEKWVNPNGFIGSNSYYITDSNGKIYNKVIETFSIIGNFNALDEKNNIFY